MKQKAFTITILILLVTAIFFTSGFQVMGQSPGLSIVGLTRQNDINPIQIGNVGELVTLTGNIDTQNGAYNVYFSNMLVASGIAEGYSVTSNFTIPESPRGSYAIILGDISENQNTSYPFTILTAFSIKAIVPTAPVQLQEGSNVVLNVTATGWIPDEPIVANVLIIPPSEVGINYTKTASLTTSSLGTARSLVTFPDVSFSPSSSSTAFLGTYSAFFNESDNLAKDNFFIGFTDLTQYHRQETIKINAVGYQPSQAATVAIQFGNNILYSQSVTASGQGVISTSWTVPPNASLGEYSLAINPITTPSKKVADLQTIQILGYSINFNSVNLAGDPVSGLSVEALDQLTRDNYTGISNNNGIAKINLEKGSYVVSAFWKQVKVGEISVTITENSTYSLTCRLTNLKIKVQDKNGILIPFVNLNLTYQFTDRTGTTQNKLEIGQTDLSGIYSFNSMLPGITYSVVASKFGAIFNTGNGTIMNLPAQTSYQVTISCPDETLTLKTVDYNLAALPNARVILVEQASGLFYSVTTDNTGTAQLSVTFGKYLVDVYTSSNVLLTQTTITVLGNVENQIQCVLYNLPISVKVVDYFGNGIGNVNIQLNRPDVAPILATTQKDGTYTFQNVIGGDIKITAYLPGSEKLYIAKIAQVNSPTTVKVAMDKYVVLSGLVIETSVLATIMILVVSILLLVLLEGSRRIGFLKLLRR